MKVIRILTIDDHEMTTMGYKYILEGAEFEDFEVKVDIATTFDRGKERMEYAAKTMPYDLILLDIQLFPPAAKEARTGEDLGVLAREISPESKVVFMSSFGDSYRINSIFKTVDPDGYMVKSEIDEKTLLSMVETVLKNPPYYTAGALSVVRKQMVSDGKVDELDRKILYYISIGTKTKDIPPLIKASLASVEARKRQLKSIFGIPSGNDLALVEEARKRGFV